MILQNQYVMGTAQVLAWLSQLWSKVEKNAMPMLIDSKVRPITTGSLKDCSDVATREREAQRIGLVVFS
jgi:hypothetical protein